MDNNVQIGLFYERKFIFDPLTVANKLKEKIKELGEVFLLPVDEKNNNPVIIFEKGEDIRLVMSFSHMMITIKNTDDKFAKNSMKSIFSILKAVGIDITRIGYITNNVLGSKEANLFKNNAFEGQEILDADDFQLSYYKKDVIEKLDINCWKRYFTDYDKFIVSMDINTLIEDKHEVNYNFTMNFIELCEEYIANNQIVKLI